MAVKNQRMIVNIETVVAGNLILARLDGFVHEFFYPPAIDAHDVVMVPAIIEFKHRVATFEIVSPHEARAFKLREHPVYRRDADIVSGCQQGLIDVFGTHVTPPAGFKDFENPEPRDSDL